MSAVSFRNLLEAGDVDGLLRHWREVAPNLPQPETREAAEIVMHMARTQTQSLHPRHRILSHCWLVDRDLPSHLPEELKPKAEQVDRSVASAVGLSVNFRSPWMRDAAGEVRGALEHAVLDAEAEGRIEDRMFVTARIDEAKSKVMRALFGR